MTVLSWISLVLVLFGFVSCSVDTGDITLLSLDNCEVTGKRIEDTLRLKTIDDNNHKALTGNFTLEYEITDEFNYDLKLDRWDDERWQENIYLSDGSMCEDVGKFFSKVMKKASDMSGLQTECPLQPGTYSFGSLRAERDDIDIKQMMHGKFKAHMKVMKPDDEMIVCKELVFEATKPF